MGPLGSAEPGDPHVLYTGDMLGSLRMHVDPTGDMLPSLRVHWLSSGCLLGRIEHKLEKQVHVLVMENTRHIGKYMIDTIYSLWSNVSGCKIHEIR